MHSVLIVKVPTRIQMRKMGSVSQQRNVARKIHHSKSRLGSDLTTSSLECLLLNAILPLPSTIFAVFSHDCKFLYEVITTLELHNYDV